MTTITLEIPDHLARAAAQAGLLDEQGIQALLSNALRQKPSLPVYAGQGGLVTGVDGLSNQSLQRACEDDA
ncbi:MAG: hypothetical protein QM569_09945 [Acidovorax sp.]|uniref:hypothetical protein n=1 Tax=Acidovorax sp. TaxID=1872122 RepID=UPI0039E65D4B